MTADLMKENTHRNHKYDSNLHHKERENKTHLVHSTTFEGKSQTMKQ